MHKIISNLIACLIILGWLCGNVYAQQGELAQDCDGQVSRQPPNVTLSCSGWFIRLYTPAGSKWGRISGATREQVLRELERGRKIDHKAFPNNQSRPGHLSYDYPSEPICEMCDRAATRVKPPWSAFCANPSIADAANVRKSYLCTGAVRELEDWGGRLMRTVPGLLDKLERPNPFGDVFSVIGPYLTSLGDAMRRVNDLREKLKSATDWTEIDTGLNEVRRQIEQAEQEYNRLPVNVKAWLEGRNVNSIDGVWVSEERGGMRIVQSGERLQIYDPASGQLMWSAMRSGDTFVIPPARRPFGIANAADCGLSSNVVYRDISYRIHISADRRSLTLEEITDKFTAGSCELGGSFVLGTWHKR